MIQQNFLLLIRIQIRDAIQNGKIEDATRMVQEISPELLDDDKYLNFSLQVTMNHGLLILESVNTI